MKYRTLVVDPPWAYSLRAHDTTHRGRNPYPTMSLAEMASVDVPAWSETEAHLYLWTTNAFMVDAHELAFMWGFTQKTILTWVKPHYGLGNYFRNSTEHVLFCVKGSLATLRKDVPTHFIAPRGRHSEKPAAFYDMVQTMSPGPYLDVFARKQRFNFDTWGNECYLPEGMTL